MPNFKDKYPQIDVRLRLSDRAIDVTAEGLDVAFHLGILEDSNLKVRVIAECPRVLCAAPAYLSRRGLPPDGEALVRDRHDCLNLRFPGAKEFQWTLKTNEGPRRFEPEAPDGRGQRFDRGDRRFLPRDTRRLHTASITGEALFAPGIAVDMVATQFPEAGLVALGELQRIHPLGRFPEIEMRHQKSGRPAMGG